MFLQDLDLSTALRPELLPDETLLFVQDGIGLYEGKYKIPEFQNGHVYLTSHRICYVDNSEPRQKSTAIDLKRVERYEFYAGFLKSSPKITLYPKPDKRSSIQFRNPSTYTPQISSYPPSRSNTASPLPRGGSPRPLASNNVRPQVNWVCPICSFSNTLPPGLEPTTANAHTPLPPCKACGIKPPLSHLLKAVISEAKARQGLLIPSASFQQQQSESNSSGGIKEPNLQPQETLSTQATVQCPRCTFMNHIQLLSCEICGASLISTANPATRSQAGLSFRSESPGPSLGKERNSTGDSPEYIKISFRAGGDKVFHERLRSAMIQRKWLLQNAPPVPQAFTRSTPPSSGISTPDRPKGVGIAGLERLGLDLRKNNENITSTAFDDFETLMASAKEIIEIAESFAKKNPAGSDTESSAALSMAITKDMLGSASGSETLYLSELSRNLAEYLTDDTRGVLKKEGGIVSLVDLWATFNRARNGVELVSPTDFEKAARMWEKLNLPVRLREFKNGLLVVQSADRTDEKTVAQLFAWLNQMRSEGPRAEVSWDWGKLGRGVTAHETAAKFGWSLGVATEELEMAEERGTLCREDGVEGLKFWINGINTVNGGGYELFLILKSLKG